MITHRTSVDGQRPLLVGASPPSCTGHPLPTTLVLSATCGPGRDGGEHSGVINAIGAGNGIRQRPLTDRGEVRARLFHPQQPEHRPAHLRSEPERGPGGQCRPADRAERRGL